MIKERKGDLFQILDYPYPTQLAIAHGCNSIGVMGAGFTKPVRKIYGEEMFEEYRHKCKHWGLRPGDLHVWVRPGLPILYNLITQNNISNDRATPERVFQSCFKMFEHTKENLEVQNLVFGESSFQIHMPAVGCGLGGLKKPEVQEAILAALHDSKASECRGLEVYWWELE